MSLNESLTFGPGAMMAASYALEGQETSFDFFLFWETATCLAGKQVIHLEQFSFAGE